MNDILGADIAIFGRSESTAWKLIASSNESFITLP